MILLLSLNNSPSSVVEIISDEFKCKKETARRELRNMSRWAEKVLLDKEMTNLLKGKLEFLARQANDALIGSETTKDKIDAMNISLKITQAQMKIHDKGRLLSDQKHEVKQSLDYSLPYERNPEIMAAYRKASAQQKAEKENQKLQEKSEEQNQVSP